MMAAQGVANGTPLQGVLGQQNAYSQSPGLQTAVSKYLGVPQPVDLSATQQALNPTPDQTAAKQASQKAAAAQKRALAPPAPKAIKAPKGGWTKAKLPRIRKTRSILKRPRRTG